jgi:basic amino acid/polyamine antiporter, APA family
MSGDGLVRSLGLPAMTANAVNCIVASGIFVLPAVVAASLGPSWLIAYVICAVAITLVFLSLAEAASRVSETGGTYRYVEVAFGPYAGVLLGAVLWLSDIASSAAVADVFAGTLGAVVPVLATTVGRDVLLVVTYAILTTINIRDVRAGAAVVITVTIAKIAPLVILIVGGLFALHGQHVPVWGHASIHDIGQTSVILFFAFTGIEVALTPSGEVTDPARTMPRAVLLALVIVTAIYIGVHYVAQGVLGPGLATDQVAPLASTATRLFGPRGGALMLGAAALATFAYVSGDILASPRIMFAFARDGYLPQSLGRIHPRHHTPYVAIIWYSAIACALAITGSFRIMAFIGSISGLIIYLGCCLALIVLRRRDQRADGPPFLVPGGLVIPVLACVVIVWLLTQTPLAAYRSVAFVVALASVLYYLRARRRGSPAPASGA